jgi:hypothetical protein
MAIFGAGTRVWVGRSAVVSGRLGLEPVVASRVNVGGEEDEAEAKSGAGRNRGIAPCPVADFPDESPSDAVVLPSDSRALLMFELFVFLLIIGNEKKFFNGLFNESSSELVLKLSLVYV